MVGALKSLIKRLPYAAILRLYYAWARLQYWPRFERSRRRAGIPFLDAIDLSAVKRSDTLFVLASGPSINCIREERWSAIRAADSVGFNFWPFHPFVPTYYFFESMPPDRLPELAARLLGLFQQRARDYAGTIKVAMDLIHEGRQFVYDLPAGWRENLFAARNIPVIARTADEFRYAVSYWQRRGLFEPEGRIRSMMKFCATLSTLLTFAAKLRYRRIVLCGVDLKSQDYFYQDPELYPGSASFVVVPREGKHETMAQLSWVVPIDEVLLEIRSQVLDPAGIEVYVESPNSLLCPRIPAAPDSLFQDVLTSARGTKPARVGGG